MSESTHSEPVAAVVVAAGSGVRLGGEIPKALRLLGGRSLVAWAVDSLAAGGVTDVVVVVADGLEDDFEVALADSLVSYRIVVGGASRQESVRRGLAAVGGCDVVLVHDAARPLVPAQVVASVVEAVRGGASVCIPTVPVSDTIRQDVDSGNVVVDRSTLRAVQTPQGFTYDVLLAAHDQAKGADYTDDAAVCEAAGHAVVLVPGSREAFKVTEPFDLLVAEAVLRSRA